MAGGLSTTAVHYSTNADNEKKVKKKRVSAMEEHNKKYHKKRPISNYKWGVDKKKDSAVVILVLGIFGLGVYYYGWIYTVPKGNKLFEPGALEDVMSTLRNQKKPKD